MEKFVRLTEDVGILKVGSFAICIGQSGELLWYGLRPLKAPSVPFLAEEHQFVTVTVLQVKWTFILSGEEISAGTPVVILSKDHSSALVQTVESGKVFQVSPNDLDEISIETAYPKLIVAV